MSGLPRYLQERRIASGLAYYWNVPKGSRPDIQVRSAALGTDRDAAIAVAERMISDADARRPDPMLAHLERKTRLAQRFAGLDALSRDRALTDAESIELEQVMRDLRMIEL